MTARLESALAELADALREELRAELTNGSTAPERLLSVAEAADTLGIGRSKVYSEIAARRLRSLTIGDRRLIPSTALAEYVAAQSPPEAG